MSSIEEKIEDQAKKQLSNGNVRYFAKTESINPEIDNALALAPSKSGGKGKNYPDIKVFVTLEDMRNIPVMIEVKGKKGDLIKTDSDDNIDNTTKDGQPNYNNIMKYAVNGAVHYANAILKNTKTYKECIAIGLNGYEENNELKTEIKVYYISQNNLLVPKEVGHFSDLSFLFPDHVYEFVSLIDTLDLTPEEIEKKQKEYENEIEIKLKKLNQTMQDDLKISVGSRVELITGMIMAGIGVENQVAPLDISDLKGESSNSSNDGIVIINKIKSFLESKNLPNEKKEMIIDSLKQVFLYADLWKPINGESKLKTVYTTVEKEIMPIFTSGKHLDFTGKLFNVLNDWVDVPDGDKNDVVLTPRYITDLMTKLCKVDMNSYVWDYAAGSGGFLISAMKEMINDANRRINSPQERNEKISKIKHEQLLGIEKLPDIYLLAVLNMILMGDGSSNIIHADSLTEFNGNYEQGNLKGQEFPANVFLLNPPYSAQGKGFIFAEKALKKMKGGKAAILIQENAGSGNGLPYTKRILQSNTLLASIHMADIFRGKSVVQTAIYLFEVGKPHDERNIVKFIDFSNDGYSRQHKKKSGQDVNLKNVDHAIERYQEVIDLVLYGKNSLHYLSEENYIEDTISLNGKDWTFSQHIEIETKPTEADFKKAIEEFLTWKASRIMNRGDNDE